MLIPFGGYKAMAFWPLIFVRRKYKYGVNKFNEYNRNHEEIHLAQQLECLLIGFYIIWLGELIFKGYRNISFEKEAYDNMYNLNYLEKREKYANFKHY